jgi:hypothetical protein
MPRTWEQARVDEELDRLEITNVAVAQRATLAEKPVSPSKMLVGALSMLLAVAGTMALVLGSEKLDSRLHGEEHVEQVLRLPVLAAIPEGRAYARPGIAIPRDVTDLNGTASLSSLLASQAGHK